ncbi:MAG: dihydroorotase [Clostridia bacterium]|nr:dihydroorotase [Clostridia bacterium]
MKGTDKRFADAAFNAAENACFDGSVIRIFDDKNIILIPGFVDMHVHFRQPGFCYKETIKSGSLAAASAGYTTVCTMPNLSPAPDCAEHIEEQLKHINSDGVIGIIPYSCITKGRCGISPVDFGEMIKYTRLFSDDGSGVQSTETVEQAMRKCAEHGGIYASHCEVNELLLGGYIHDGQYARTHGHRGISSASEYVMIERDIELVRKTNCRYHVCHISTKEGVELVRRAKADGLPVTCETAPHYLILCDDDLQEDGRFKMNPPLRSSSDRDALINGIKDGTIDVIATDHAPHSKEEKSRGLEKSLMGITGLETAFPILYTHLVKTGVISLELLLKLMCYAPRQILGIPCRKDCFAVIDLDKKYTIDPESFISMGKSTPFESYEVFGKNLLTVYNGNIVWQI